MRWAFGAARRRLHRGTGTAAKGGVVDRLNPLDAAFVDAEDEDRHPSMAIASIAVFEGPAPSYDDVYQAVARRLPLVPIYGTIKLHLSGT